MGVVCASSARYSIPSWSLPGSLDRGLDRQQQDSGKTPNVTSILTRAVPRSSSHSPPRTLVRDRRTRPPLLHCTTILGRAHMRPPMQRFCRCVLDVALLRWQHNIAHPGLCRSVFVSCSRPRLILIDWYRCAGREEERHTCRKLAHLYQEPWAILIPILHPPRRQSFLSRLWALPSPPLRIRGVRGLVHPQGDHCTAAEC
jgi:hypothetical protein